jgi:hypothetical protein
MPAIYTLEQAHLVTAGLNATDTENWTYSVHQIGNGMAYIAAADDAGEFIAYLEIRLTAESTADTTRISGGGHVITLDNTRA